MIDPLKLLYIICFFVVVDVDIFNDDWLLIDDDDDDALSLSLKCKARPWIQLLCRPFLDSKSNAVELINRNFIIFIYFSLSNSLYL